MIHKNTETFCPSSQTDWRNWLIENHISKQSVWLVFYKKNFKNPTLFWSEAVDEALCFGWIDSVKKTIDDIGYKQLFSKRKAQSTWSKINKEKVDYLIEQGLMREAGLKSIRIAEQNGYWTILDKVEKLIIPRDLDRAFKTKGNSKDFFLSLSKSKRKALLQWIVLAKLNETREKRISKIAELASNNEVPKQFR
ncbi:YdeI/OmpD-associated family protein [Autumnicola musiva]|uniref:YdeI/OmpD-associated family protein n=1 Tax=Autumnicola musiva TaxID=3075589 RepID=A0ABU3DB57_9FLAO|nr:YdeI/OmpD-associated family protein [Zunongwangia sp. F117]MDT0678765.1 YdeI/OmpD-associated family protein [Zunongwangia sp. F117]